MRRNSTIKLLYSLIKSSVQISTNASPPAEVMQRVTIIVGELYVGRKDELGHNSL